MNLSTEVPVAHDPRFTQCRPVTVASYDIEASLWRPGAEIRVQRYRWSEPLANGFFKPAVCYLDLALIPRVPDIEAACLGLSPSRAPVFRPIGDCVFVPAEQEITAHNPAGEHRVLTCLFDPDKLQSYLEIDSPPVAPAACFNIKNPHIRAGLARLAEEALAPGFASEVIIDSTLNALIVELTRHLRGKRTADASGSKLSQQQLRRIKDQVENAVGQWPHLTTLAARCGISSRQLTRAFKNTTGRTLSEYVAEVRLRHAKQLLLDPTVLIKTIAYQCGFNSQAAFAAAFRRETGWAPRQFRRAAENATNRPAFD